MRKFLALLAGMTLLGLGVLTGMLLAGFGPFDDMGDQLGLVERGSGTVEIFTEGKLPESALQDVRQTANVFSSLMDQEMGTPLTHSVRLYVTAGKKDYQAVLEREFELTAQEARHVAGISGGWSGGSRHLTAINAGAGVMVSSTDRHSTTAHELFHQLQYELSDGHDTDREALFWLEEGTADYVGALVAEKLGGQSLEKWRLDSQLDVLLAAKPVEPEKLMHCTMEQRQKLMGKEYHAYQVAGVMTGYLLSRLPPEQRLPAVASYFRYLAEAQTGEQAFRQAFGIGLETFLQDYKAWWVAFCQQPATFHCLVWEGVDAQRRDMLERQLQETQDELTRKLGTGCKIRGEFQVVLAADEQRLAAAASKYCDLPQDKARELAKHSLGIENGSTLLINTQKLNDSRQCSLSVGILLLRSLEGQYLGRGEQRQDIAWLSRGMSYVFGINSYLAKEGRNTGRYYEALRSELRGYALPKLSGLVSDKAYSEAAAAYEAERVSNFTELAAYELISRYGWKAFAKWLEETRRCRNAEAAFLQVYGQASDTFAAKFQASLY